MLSEAFLRSLRGLKLNSPKRRVGTTTGERRSLKRGRSVEFADYRNYTPGDDPRRVDWNIYARLEKPFIKLFEDEEDLVTHILLDASASMQWRDDDADEQTSGKFQRARDLVLALSYISLAAGDKLIIETNTQQRLGPKRGIAAIGEVMKFVEKLAQKAQPPTALNAWLKRYAVNTRSGFCIVVSDFLDEAGYEDGLSALANARLDIHVLHTLCPAELDPQLLGDMRLKDVETEHTQDLSMDDAVLSQYRERLNVFTNGLAAFARKRGGRYVLADTAKPIEELMLKELRRAEWIA